MRQSDSDGVGRQVCRHCCEVGGEGWEVSKQTRGGGFGCASLAPTNLGRPGLGISRDDPSLTRSYETLRVT
jgi:hypothetical protein